MESIPKSSHRKQASGYWGRGLLRREAGSGVVQLHEANAPPEAVSAHGHARAHIVFVTNGAYVTSVTGENGFVDRPVAVINPPGVWHRDHFVTGRGSFMTIDLKCDGLAEDFVRHEQSAGVVQFCHRLASTLGSKSALEIDDNLAALSALYKFDRPQELDGIPNSVERAFQAIQDAANPWDLNMAQLAQIADVHVNHLPRAFRRRFGISPSQLAAARQIELCARPLLKARKHWQIALRASASTIRRICPRAFASTRDFPHRNGVRTFGREVRFFQDGNARAG